MKLKYFFAWLPGIIIAIVNGTLRQFVYREYFDELSAHQLSGLSFVILFGVYIWYILPKLKLSSRGEAMRMGLSWLGMTIAFEFVFGHFVMGHAWSKLLYDYNILEGRLWVIVLIWTTVAPFVLFRLQNKRLFTFS